MLGGQRELGRVPLPFPLSWSRGAEYACSPQREEESPTQAQLSSSCDRILPSFFRRVGRGVAALGPGRPQTRFPGRGLGGGHGTVFRKETSNPNPLQCAALNPTPQDFSSAPSSQSVVTPLPLGKGIKLPLSNPWLPPPTPRPHGPHQAASSSMPLGPAPRQAWDTTPTVSWGRLAQSHWLGSWLGWSGPCLTSLKRPHIQVFPGLL